MDEPNQISDVELTGARKRVRRRIFERQLAVWSYCTSAGGSVALATWFIPIIVSQGAPTDLARAVAVIGFPSGIVTLVILAIQQWSAACDLKQLAEELEPIWEAGAGTSRNCELWQNYKVLCFPKEK